MYIDMCLHMLCLYLLYLCEAIETQSSRHRNHAEGSVVSSCKSQKWFGRVSDEKRRQAAVMYAKQNAVQPLVMCTPAEGQSAESSGMMQYRTISGLYMQPEAEDGKVRQSAVQPLVLHIPTMFRDQAESSRTISHEYPYPGTEYTETRQKAVAPLVMYTLTQGQNAERFLNLHTNLLNAKQQECNDCGCGDHCQATGLPQSEGQQSQPDDQEARCVPAHAQHH